MSDLNQQASSFEFFHPTNKPVPGHLFECCVVLRIMPNMAMYVLMVTICWREQESDLCLCTNSLCLCLRILTLSKTKKSKLGKAKTT